jgi:nitronate monooxygenase
LTALLGIRHPFLLAPMDTISGSRLTRAVSEAGGFGILGGGYGDRARLEAETAKLKDFTGPFGIGFITWSLAKKPELLDMRSMPIRAPSCCRSAIPRRSRRRSRRRVRC